MVDDQSFSKVLRLRKQKDFDAVYAVDFFAADQTLVIRARRNGLTHPRLGLSISRRVGNAVTRNHWKRRIREAFRRSRVELPNLDIVVRPRKGGRCEFALIQKSILRLTQRLDQKIPTV